MLLKRPIGAPKPICSLTSPLAAHKERTACPDAPSNRPQPPPALSVNAADKRRCHNRAQQPTPRTSADVTNTNKRRGSAPTPQTRQTQTNTMGISRRRRHTPTPWEQKNQNPARLASSGVSGAQDRTRTCTLSLALVPETSVSTNSTTWAWPVDVRHRCDRLTGCKGRQNFVTS